MCGRRCFVIARAQPEAIQKLMDNGEWRMENGLARQRFASGEWRVDNGELDAPAN
jgi:hypothetical protein